MLTNILVEIKNFAIICSKISNIPYNLIFTTKFNDSSILITIISCDDFNLLLVNEYIGDQLRLSSYSIFSFIFLQAQKAAGMQVIFLCLLSTKSKCGNINLVYIYRYYKYIRLGSCEFWLKLRHKERRVWRYQRGNQKP